MVRTIGRVLDLHLPESLGDCRNARTSGRAVLPHTHPGTYSLTGTSCCINTASSPNASCWSLVPFERWLALEKTLFFFFLLCSLRHHYIHPLTVEFCTMKMSMPYLGTLGGLGGPRGLRLGHSSYFWLGGRSEERKGSVGIFRKGGFSIAGAKVTRRVGERKGDRKSVV